MQVQGLPAGPNRNDQTGICGVVSGSARPSLPYLASFPPELRLFLVSGHEYTHVTFHGDIRRSLAAV